MRAANDRKRNQGSRERQVSPSPKRNNPSSISQSFASSVMTSTMFTDGGRTLEQHIPYRNSPLTKILKNSLSGNSRTCIIVCITPSVHYVDQSISSLRFGQNAMKVENSVKANIF